MPREAIAIVGGREGHLSGELRIGAKAETDKREKEEGNGSGKGYGLQLG